MSLKSCLPIWIALYSSTAMAVPDDFEFDLEGYYRTRGYVMGNLVQGQEEPGKLMLQRLRIQPEINFQDRAKFFMQMDLLDDTAWGDNSSLATTALFAGQPSNVGADGNAVDRYGRSYDSLHVNRAWMEFDLPIGKMRVGRQESHWGMGLLANHGNGFDDLFGENHGGSTYDRIIFATKPIAIVQTIMGRPVADIPLFMAFGVDRLVEEPLTDYYGYTCEEDLEKGVDEGYDSRCDPDDTGWNTLDHDYTNEDRSYEQRGDDWWLDNTDDVYQVLGVLIYKGEGLNLGGDVADMTVGAYGIIRTQDETDSRAVILDAYYRLSWKRLLIESEVLHIGGNSRAITLDGAYDPFEEVDPLYKDVDIWGYVARLGQQTPSLDLIMEHGYASGDDNVADQVFTGRPIHEDYNVGLLLYEEVLARVTSRTWSDKASSLWSRGGIYNSNYIYPHIRYRPLNTWEIRAAWLKIWPDKPDGARILCGEADVEAKDIQCTDPQDDLASSIGWEANLGLHQRFHDDHILFAVEGAYAEATNRLPLENIGLNPDGKFWTVQTRFAYVF